MQDNLDVETSLHEQVKQREALILGQPPRIRPLKDEAIVALAIENTQRIRQAAGSTTPVTANTIPELVTTLMRHPDLYEAISKVSIQLQGRGVLLQRDRQLATLRTAWLLQAPYAWGEHVKHSKRMGFAKEDFEAIVQGAAAPHWNEHERAILQAVEELHRGAMIADSTWAVLSRRLDEKQLFELTVLVGQFTTIAYVQNSLRLRLAEGNIGLGAR